MTNRLEKGAIAPALELPCIWFGMAQQQPDTDKAGKMATFSELTSKHNLVLNLGRPTQAGHVLFFYPKDDSPGCTAEAVDFNNLRGAFAALGYGIIGLSRNSLEEHHRFALKHNLSIPLASDTEGEACEAFGVWVEKRLYGRTFMGIERTTFVIHHTGRCLALWNKVKVKTHAQSVLASLSNLDTHVHGFER